jgi:hypothetical protein
MKKLALTLLPLLAACGNPFQAKVEADQVCVRQLNQTLPGLGAAPAVAGALPATPTLNGRITDTFEITAADLAELREDGQFDAELGLQSFKFSPPPGTNIENLHVVLTPPPGSDLPPVTLIQYPAPAGEEGLIRFENGEFVGDLSPLGDDLMDYLESDSLTLDLVAEGDIPATEWQANLEVCAAASAEYDYGKELGL